MRLRQFFCALTAAFLLGIMPASAALLITIDKTVQRMSVVMDGQEIFNWPVSTGTRSYDTPSGSYKPFRMEADHYSKEWDDAPMPHSIFFTQIGHAIHGTTHTKAIGTPASHGCVRLEPQNAETLFKLVKQEKMANTRIVLTGTTPAPAPPPVASAPAERRQARPEARALPQDDFTGALTERREALRDPYREEGWRYEGGDLGRPNRGYAQPSPRERAYRGEVFYDRYGRAYVYERRGNYYYAQPFDAPPRPPRGAPWGWN